MRFKKQLACLLGLVFLGTYAQKSYVVKGYFPESKNAKIDLVGYRTLQDTTLLAKGETDNLGNFTLSYPANYRGAAALKVKEGPSLIVLLDQENFGMNWIDLNDFKTLKFANSPENDAFAKGIFLYQEAENILSGLKYLKPFYKDSPSESKWIIKEIIAKEKSLPTFIDKLPKESYAKYYLGVRKLIQDMPTTANRYPERIPDHEKQFAGIDFSDIRLQRSGLYKELLDSFYMLLESYGDLKVVAEHSQLATNALLKSLDKDPKLKQEVAEYLFKYLEKRSLFLCAEQVAVAMLNDQSCQLDSKKIALYEQYRKMNIGAIANDITLEANDKGVKRLSELNTKYKIVVFGSSWCDKCKVEIPAFQNKYSQWKEKGYDFEIVFISLDTDSLKYKAFVNDFPWISSCDFKGWETQSAIDYCIFATPTIYLLDAQNKILLKPASAAQINSWFIGHEGEKK